VFGKREGGDYVFEKIDRSLREQSLLTVFIFVNKIKHVALIDTGSSVSLISKRCVLKEKVFSQKVNLHLIDGSFLSCSGFVVLNKVFCNNEQQISELKCFVVDKLPDNVDLVLGIDSIVKLDILRLNCDFKIAANSLSNFSAGIRNERKLIEIRDPDFYASFNDKIWTVRWNWNPEVSQKNGCLSPREFVKNEDREGFNKEIETWINEGILVRYNEIEHGNIIRFLPTMSVRQEKGENVKIRPVMDYRDLNKAVMSHPGGSLPLYRESNTKVETMG